MILSVVLVIDIAKGMPIWFHQYVWCLKLMEKKKKNKRAPNSVANP